MRQIIKELLNKGLKEEAYKIQEIISSFKIVPTKKINVYEVYKNGSSLAKDVNVIWKCYTMDEAIKIQNFLREYPYATGDEKKDFNIKIRINKTDMDIEEAYLKKLTQFYHTNALELAPNGG